MRIFVLALSVAAVVGGLLIAIQFAGWIFGGVSEFSSARAAAREERSSPPPTSVILEQRRFYLGQAGRAYDEGNIYLNRLGFLDRAIEAMNKEGSAIIQISAFSGSGRVTANEKNDQIRIGNAEGIVRVPEVEGDVAGYDVFYDERSKADTWFLLPIEATTAHSFRCKSWLEPDGNQLCNLEADYPYDSQLGVTGYFVTPFPTPDLSIKLEEFAKRAVELAICLDITGIPFPKDQDTFVASQSTFSECEARPSD